MRRGDKPRVALLVETSGAYGRSVLAGVARYARLHGPWSFYILPRAQAQGLPDMKFWQGTGIIARIESQETAKAIGAAGVPVIGLDLAIDRSSSFASGIRLSEMHPDPEATARMAADHLLERGFRAFAFVGIRGHIWSQQRERAFIEYIRAHTHAPCLVAALTEAKRTVEYGREQQRLATWLKQLPKPVGVMACNDDCGREVLDAALQAGVSVPDEVAVVGVDNDEVLCELCDPPMSSVALNAEKGGYEAASLLDGLMRGKVKAPRTILVDPVGVVARRSTEVWAVQDPRIAVALQYIRDHAGEPTTVSDVLKTVPMSRRALEIRFKEVVRRTIHDEIIASRVRLARRLLLETDLTLDVLAEKVGFGSASHLSVVFSRQVGLAPARFRKEHRTW
jgi:LacI family transcriptional regulator